jgi:hypothetical protein
MNTNINQTPEARKWEQMKIDCVEALIDNGFEEQTANESFEATLPIWKFLFTSVLKEATTCNKPVENGKAICGCKLDCHLHDWRQKEQIATALREQRDKIKSIVESIDDTGGGSGRRLKIQLLDYLSK